MKTFRLWLYRLIVHNLPETRLFGFKVALLRWCGASVGKNVRVCSSALFMGNGHLVIGNDVWIGAGCRISPVGGAEIKIGDHCDLGPEVMILSGGHQIDPDGDHIGGKGMSASVLINSGCWLGARSTILPGVTLAEKTLVAAGAVVKESTKEPKTLIAGVPAQEKKRFG